MNFLFPLFLLGALAIAAPVIFHLIRRTTKVRLPFSSLMFLKPTPPRLTKRNRLEHILLLLLRCAVLCLLAAGFARPFFKQVDTDTTPPGQAKHIIVLVDTSASMRRGDLWSQARSKAEEVLRRAQPMDHVAVFAFDRDLKPLVTFEQWDGAPIADRVAFAQSRIAEAKPTWAATLLDQALIRTAETLADTGETNSAGPRQIFVISDMQTGSRVSGLQAFDWPKGLEVQIESLSPRKTSNAGLQLVADATDSTRASEVNVRVRVSNEPDSKKEQFQVGWARDGGVFVTNAAQLYIPPGQSRVVTLPTPPTNSAADRLVLRGDDEDFDNVVYAVPPQATRLSVLYFGAEKENEVRQPLFFVASAFQETLRQAVQVRAFAPNAPLPEDQASASTLLIATDVLPTERAQALRGLVNDGRTLLFAPRNTDAFATLKSVLGLDQLAATEVKPPTYAMFGEIDFRHPIFAPFADPRFSDFTRIHFWQYRRLDATSIPGARSVAKLDNGDPAILEVPLGKGRVIILTSCWYPTDSQLALSSKFVPLLYSILELSGSVASAPAQYAVGDTVTLPGDLGRATNTLSLTGPEGAALTLAAGQTNFTQTTLPGIYRVNTGERTVRFAVNLDSAESHTAPLAADELERLGAPTPRQVTTVAHVEARKAQLQSAELEGRQKLWRWFVLAALLIVLVETWLAGWTSRRQMAQAPAT